MSDPSSPIVVQAAPEPSVAAGLTGYLPIATALAFTGLGVALARLARRQCERRFSRTILLVAAFMLMSGVGPLVGLMAPAPLTAHAWVGSAVAVATAVLGIAAAAALWSALPAVLAATAPEVGRANAALEVRFAERTRELERSNRELEQFAYVASHDLREPLRMVTSYTDLIAKRYRGKLDATGDEFIGYVVDGCQRMRQLILDLLEYSRLDRRPSLQLVDVEAAFAIACHDLAVPIARAGTIVTHARLPAIRCTPSQLAQLLANLLRNAVTYRAERPSRVHASAVERGGEIVLSVSDNGIGLEMRNADRIFGMFQRLHAREEYPGTGMGLALCKKIMECHDGRIWVDAEPGVGATFSCAFPQPSTVSTTTER